MRPWLPGSVFPHLLNNKNTRSTHSSAFLGARADEFVERIPSNLLLDGFALHSSSISPAPKIQLPQGSHHARSPLELPTAVLHLPPCS